MEEDGWCTLTAEPRQERGFKEKRRKGIRRKSDFWGTFFWHGCTDRSLVSRHSAVPLSDRKPRRLLVGMFMFGLNTNSSWIIPPAPWCCPSACLSAVVLCCCCCDVHSLHHGVAMTGAESPAHFVKQQCYHQQSEWCDAAAEGEDAEEECVCVFYGQCELISFLSCKRNRFIWKMSPWQYLTERQWVDI